VYPFKHKLFIKILSSSLNNMLIVDKDCSDVCCDEFSVPQIDHKSKELKERWLGKFYLQSVWGKLSILNSENIKICGWITKSEAIKNCLVFLPHLQKIWIFNFPRQCSSVPKVRWLVSNFIRFPAVQKFWKSVKIWLSYRHFKRGNFLRHLHIFSGCKFRL